MTVIKGFKVGETVPKGSKFVYAEKRKVEPHYDALVNKKWDDEITFYYEVEVKEEEPNV